MFVSDSITNLSISQDIPRLDFATLDLLPYGTIVLDGVGKILYYNDREAEISRRKKDDVIGKNFFSEVAPCTQVADFQGRFLESMRRTGEVGSFRFSFPFEWKKAEVEITFTPFDAANENLCLVSIKDVTEQDEIRDRMIQAERLREIGETASGVAHNFNNLLTVIMGNVELLLRTSAPATGTLRSRLETILKASKDGVEMVQRIKESTRQLDESADCNEYVDLNDSLIESVAFCDDYRNHARNESGVEIKIELELSEEPLKTLGRASELREVFVNLIRNSIDAISEKGEVIVRSRLSGKFNSVQIADTGGGMEKETLDRIFRPLFTTKGEKGTGFGLATCYAIVRRHKGEIKVESTVDKGTTVTVTFPGNE